MLFAIVDLYLYIFESAFAHDSPPPKNDKKMMWCCTFSCCYERHSSRETQACDFKRRFRSEAQTRRKLYQLHAFLFSVVWAAFDVTCLLLSVAYSWMQVTFFCSSVVAWFRLT